MLGEALYCTHCSETLIEHVPYLQTAEPIIHIHTYNFRTYLDGHRKCGAS